MSARSSARVLGFLTEEPVTPNEIASKAGLNQKTAQTVLLELYGANNKQVRMKKIGRYRLFWKVGAGKK